MNTEYLKYFIAACEHGSILEASKNLFISAQGLGQGIRRLERSIGIELLESSYNGVRPTAFGEKFYSQAMIASKEYDKLEKMAEDYLKEVQKTIKLGTIGQTKFYHGIQDCIHKYEQKYPESGLKLEIIQSYKGNELMESIENGTIDIGLMFHTEMPEQFSCRTLSDYSPLYLIISRDHPLAKEKSVPFEVLKDVSFVVAANEDPFADLLNDLFEQHGMIPNNIFFSTENSNNARLLDSGICSMILRSCYVDSILQFCSNSTAVRIDPDIPVAFSLFWKKCRSFDSDRQLFLDMLIQYFEILFK